VYDLAWGADDKDGKKKKGNSGLPHQKNLLKKKIDLKFV
jgi:hypothetical protein